MLSFVESTYNIFFCSRIFTLGIGQRQLNEFSAALEMPCMANTTYSRIHKSIHSSIQVAWTEMLKAGEE